MIMNRIVLSPFRFGFGAGLPDGLDRINRFLPAEPRPGQSSAYRLFRAAANAAGAGSLIVYYFFRR
jgi:hypothetical protein